LADGILLRWFIEAIFPNVNPTHKCIENFLFSILLINYKKII
jgi:hypothetical protein